MCHGAPRPRAGGLPRVRVGIPPSTLAAIRVGSARRLPNRGLNTRSSATRRLLRPTKVTIKLPLWLLADRQCRRVELLLLPTLLARPAPSSTATGTPPSAELAVLPEGA